MMSRNWPWLAATAVLVSSLFALPATAATPGTGPWGGGTSQGRTLQFGVKKSGARLMVKRIAISSVRLRCQDPLDKISYKVLNGVKLGPGDAVVRRGGRFAFRQAGSLPPGYMNLFKGHFTSKRSAKGILRLTDSHSNTDCDSGRISWTASLR
jgi:hypothetical protein